MNYFIFLLPILLVISGLHKTCGSQKSVILSTTEKIGEFSICYRNTLESGKSLWNCTYQDEKYSEGEVVVDGCKVCYCTHERQMKCATLCTGVNQKAILKPFSREYPFGIPMVCARYSHKVLCKPEDKGPGKCDVYGTTEREGIVFSRNGIIICNENGSITIMAVYDHGLCSSSIYCEYNGKFYIVGNMLDIPGKKNCECRTDGTVKCEEATHAKPHCPKKEPKCFHNFTMVDVGPIPGSNCNCTEKLTVECEETEQKTEGFCEYLGQTYNPGPIPGMNCNCTDSGIVACDPMMMDTSGKCYYENIYVDVGEINGTDCVCTENFDIVCPDSGTMMMDAPGIVCEFNGQDYQVGKIPGTNCTCNPNGEATCKEDGMMINSKVTCKYNGKKVDIGIIPDSTCICHENGSYTCGMKPKPKNDGKGICSYNGKDYGIGPIPGPNDCVCTPNGKVDCAQSMMMDEPAGGCDFQGGWKPYGPIEDTNCTCEEESSERKGAVYCLQES